MDGKVTVVFKRSEHHPEDVPADQPLEMFTATLQTEVEGG